MFSLHHGNIGMNLAPGREIVSQVAPTKTRMLGNNGRWRPSRRMFPRAMRSAPELVPMATPTVMFQYREPTNVGRVS